MTEPSPPSPPIDESVEFPILAKSIYLNHASVAPMPARTRDALRTYAEECSTMGVAGWARWKERMAATRREAATLLATTADQIGLIHNTGHGVLCAANSLPWRPGDNVLVGEHEFPANVHPWRNLAERGVAIRVVPERPDHRFRVEDFEAMIDAHTRLIAVSLVQYTTGFRMPVEALAELCRRRGLWLSVDAIQAMGAMPTRVADLGCDFLVAGGQKWLLSTNGIGLMWMNKERVGELNQSMTGWVGRPRFWDYDDWTQPALISAQRFEEGTQNVPGVVALGASLGLINAIGIDRIWENIEKLTARLEWNLARLGFTVESPRDEGERSGIVAFTRPGLDAPRWEKALAEQGIVITSRRGWLRASPHGYNRADQIDALLVALKEMPDRLAAE